MVLITQSDGCVVAKIDTAIMRIVSSCLFKSHINNFRLLPCGLLLTASMTLEDVYF